MPIHKTTVDSYLKAVSDFSDARNKLLSMENQLITNIILFAKEYFEFRKSDKKFLKEFRIYDYTALNEFETDKAVNDLKLLDKIIVNYSIELVKITSTDIFMSVIEDEGNGRRSWWPWSFPTEYLSNPEWKKEFEPVEEPPDTDSEPERTNEPDSVITDTVVTNTNISPAMNDMTQ